MILKCWSCPGKTVFKNARCFYLKKQQQRIFNYMWKFILIFCFQLLATCTQGLWRNRLQTFVFPNCLCLSTKFISLTLLWHLIYANLQKKLIKGIFPFATIKSHKDCREFFSPQLAGCISHSLPGFKASVSSSAHSSLEGKGVLKATKQLLRFYLCMYLYRPPSDTCQPADFTLKWVVWVEGLQILELSSLIL